MTSTLKGVKKNQKYAVNQYQDLEDIEGAKKYPNYGDVRCGDPQNHRREGIA